MTERYLRAGGRTSRTAVVEAEEPDLGTADILEPPGEPTRPEAPAAEEAVLGPETVDPLYPVALLKIAMAMRRLPAEETRVFEALLDDVLSDMVIDREDFRDYLERNMGRLVTAVKLRGY